MPAAENDDEEERVEREYEERSETGRKVRPPAEDPDEADVPPLTEPGAET